MKRALLPLALLALGACVSRGDYGVRGTCKAEPASRFVGQVANAESGWKILAASNARTLRWAPPGAVLTMDFNADRLTVEYDQNMIITAARCG